MSLETDIKQTIPMQPGTRSVVNLMFTARYVEDRSSGIIKQHGLTVQQYNVLRILRGQRGTAANLSTIQERMIDKSSNTTRLVDKLLVKGYANRQVCPDNRRKVEIFITPEGLKLLESLDPLVEGQNAAMVENLSESELDTLNELLDKLRNSN